jgi:DNA mismatch endonuclease, patch repair protein
MADTLSKSDRSRVMAAVRSRGNRATELRLLAILRAHGISGWRRHLGLPGNPDFVFTRERVAVFVDGCFWHGCVIHCRIPKSRAGFWSAKIGRNRERDREVGRVLRGRGWRVVRVWEHALGRPARIVARLHTALASGGKGS